MPLVEGTIFTSKSSPSVDVPEVGEQLIVPPPLKESHKDMFEGEPGFPAQLAERDIPATVLPALVIEDNVESF